MNKTKRKILKFLRTDKRFNTVEIINGTGCDRSDIDDLYNAGYLTNDPNNIMAYILTPAGYSIYILTEQQYEFQRQANWQYVITSLIAVVALICGIAF